jgi:hypothetical protein
MGILANLQMNNFGAQFMEEDYDNYDGDPKY